MAIETYDEELMPGEPKRGRGWLVPFIAILFAFAGGAVAMGYALTHWRIAAQYFAPAPVALPPAPPPARPVLIADTTVVAAIDHRIGDLESRLERSDAHAATAESNADRAEGLLVAFAARRALDRGVQLGYLEGLLRQRFGPGQPRAVSTIISAGRQPVTIDELQAGLSEMAPDLATADPRESWWSALRREFAGLIVIRQKGTPSPAPGDRMQRAKLQLEAGHVGAALAEVARMPGHDRAAGWIVQARRYAAARDALDVIETAALLAPRPTAADGSAGQAETKAEAADQSAL